MSSVLGRLGQGMVAELNRFDFALIPYRDFVGLSDCFFLATMYLLTLGKRIYTRPFLLF